MSEQEDLGHLQRAVELAREAETGGNLPIGAVIVLDGERIAEAGNRLVVPDYHPGRHAEMEALAKVPISRWPEASRMVCYSTMEPCLMCMSALLLHGVGRVVFGAKDQLGGAQYLLSTLPRYYRDGHRHLECVGPLMPDVCDELYLRADTAFRAMPCA